MTPRLQSALKHARDTRAIALGTGVLRQVPALFKEQFPGSSGRVIADPRTFQAAGADVHAALTAAGLAGGAPILLEDEPLVAEIRHVEALTGQFAAGSDIPVAVGSGTINDIVKLVAERVGRPYIVVASAAWAPLPSSMAAVNAASKKCERFANMVFSLYPLSG